MPTYQYHCPTCGYDLEVHQKFSDAPLTVCPNCGGQLRKVFNSVGIVFKGSGFYATDNRSSSHSTHTPAPSSTSSSSSTSGDSSSHSTTSSSDSSSTSSSSSTTPSTSSSN